jgi:hypothetical protein
MVFNATFNNISVISWQSVLLVINYLLVTVIHESLLIVTDNYIDRPIFNKWSIFL